MTLDDLMVLAETYRLAARISLTTMSRRCLGNNRTLPRLAAGHGCHARSLVRAAAWFAMNWPCDVPWPLETPRRIYGGANRSGEVGEARAGGLTRSGSPGRDCGA
jgi:hypothetical protein